MKTTFLTIAALILGLTLVSCDINELTGGEEEPMRIRYLHFKYAQIPDDMSDATAETQMRSQINNYLRANAAERWFIPTDSLTNPFGGQKVSINRVIVTQPGSSHNGGARLIGGQDADIHPFQPGVPSSLLMDVLGTTAAGQTGTLGEFELRFNEDELIVGGSAIDGDFMELILDTYDPQSSYAIGRFMFIARNFNDPSDTRRWAIFDGEFALQKGD